MFLMPASYILIAAEQQLQQLGWHRHLDGPGPWAWFVAMPGSATGLGPGKEPVVVALSIAVVAVEVADLPDPKPVENPWVPVLCVNLDLGFLMPL